MFGQIKKAFQSQEKKRQEEEEIRLRSIVNEISEVITRRGVQLSEMCDILNQLRIQTDLQMAKKIKEQRETINNLKINKLEKDVSQSTENSAEESEE